jgi:hypothetical protein
MKREDVLAAALRAALAELVVGTESFREGVTFRGRIDDPLDAAEMERLEALVKQCRDALGDGA